MRGTGEKKRGEARQKKGHAEAWGPRLARATTAGEVTCFQREKGRSQN